jgi:hypothetical protein
MWKNSKIFLLLLIILFTAKIFSWEKEEHQFLADLVFDSTLSFCGINFNDSLIFFPNVSINKKLWNNNSFGNISSLFSGDDISQAHCHLRGNTILQQVKPLTASFIDRVWNEIKDSPEDIQTVEVSDQSAVCNYLLHHLIALRFAKLAAQGDDDKNKLLRYALVYEAAAQNYLSDAFSAGHFLLQVSDFLAPLNYMNIRITHDYYSFEGVYVINSLGDCWQTFGDKLLQWYPYSFSRVFEACCTSLRELFLVYYTTLENEIPLRLDEWVRSISNKLTPRELANQWVYTNEGENYYSEIKMPALLFIPMPVSAAWSIRTDREDEYGIYHRKYYPQLIEENFHDPDLNEIDTGFLYSESSMPDWMIAGFFPNDTLQNLIRYNKDIASVRYVQDRYLLPSFQGYLLIAGMTYGFINGENRYGASLGFGWGFSDEFFFFLIKPTISASVMKLLDLSREWIVAADLGFGINIPVLGIFKPHIGFGYAYGFQSPFKGSGGKYFLGLDSETLPLGFTYAGLTFRIKYQFIFFDKTFHSPVLEIILH